MNSPSPNPDNYLILLWMGFALVVAGVIGACLAMVASIWFGQYLWLIPIALALLWIVHRADHYLHRWARWVEHRFQSAERKACRRQPAASERSPTDK